MVDDILKYLYFKFDTFITSTCIISKYIKIVKISIYDA